MAALSVRRLPASSLLEVTVAAAILVLVFSLALGSLARLALTGPSQLQLRGQQLVGRVAAETIRQRDWRTETWREGKVDLNREVRPDPAAPHLLHLRITATVREREIAHLQQLVYDASSTSPAP
jgi:hypothetical protein